MSFAAPSALPADFEAPTTKSFEDLHSLFFSTSEAGMPEDSDKVGGALLTDSDVLGSHSSRKVPTQGEMQTP